MYYSCIHYWCYDQPKISIATVHPSPLVPFARISVSINHTVSTPWKLGIKASVASCTWSSTRMVYIGRWDETTTNPNVPSPLT